MNIDDFSTEELIRELQKRNAIDVTCPKCKRFSITYKYYAGRGLHWHCDGCNRWIEHCICGRP